MTIEQLRNEFRTIRNTLSSSDREDWNEIQQAFEMLDTPPTPVEWVQQLQKFADERDFENALDSWIRYRCEEEAGWGLADVNQINGWSDDLPNATKAKLIRQQINYELSVQFAYEDYMADRG
jgi:hypothetical protein